MNSKDIVNLSHCPICNAPKIIQTEKNDNFNYFECYYPNNELYNQDHELYFFVRPRSLYNVELFIITDKSYSINLGLHKKKINYFYIIHSGKHLNLNDNIIHNSSNIPQLISKINNLLILS